MTEKSSLIIEGVTATPLRKIENPKGDILHAMKASSFGYVGFGEAYFSTIHLNDTKGWKKHIRMTLNLVVPVGQVKFVIHDDRDDSVSRGQTVEITLSGLNYKRLTIAPGLWLAFQGKAAGLNLILNIADFEHDPSETVMVGLEDINYQW